MARRGITASAVALVLVLAAAGPAGAVSQAPAYRGDFPDPSVLRLGTTYWAYSTGSAGRNLQVMSSSDLRTWSPPTDPLPVLPAWAQGGFTWAPSVLQQGSTFLMYYTVRNAAWGRQCVSVATSTTASGPFQDTSSGPLVCQLDRYGSIDPDPFVAPTGGRYLLWKSEDNAGGRPTQLWSQQLSVDGRSLVGTPVVLLGQDRSWQAPAIEGPSMVASGGSYYLFYGAGAWDSATAAIGYARCFSPLGPCFNASTSRPWVASHGEAVGPSGPDIFVDATGLTRIAYHAWTGAVGYQNGGVRSLWIDGVSFVNGRPVLT